MGKIKNLVRQAAVRGFHQIGYEVTPAWKVPSKPLVDHLKAVFRVYSIDTVLDVGANLGQFRSMLWEDVGFKGRIVSFEPVSNTTRRFCGALVMILIGACTALL